MIQELVDNRASGHGADDVRHNKFFTIPKFKAASTVSYVLVVIWPHGKL